MIRKSTGRRNTTRRSPEQPSRRATKPLAKRAFSKKVAPARAKAPAPVRARSGSRLPGPATPLPVLSSREARALRAKAHALEPIVHVGHSGVSESVVQAVSSALRDHELIKVRLHEPEDKHAMASQLAGAARAALCGLVGHTLILYRPRAKEKSTSGIARSSIRRNQQPKGRTPRRAGSTR